MALFPVQRYYGEEEDLVKVDHEKSLRIFLEKIKQREKLQELELAKVNNVDDTKISSTAPVLNQSKNVDVTIQLKKERKKKHTNNTSKTDSTGTLSSSLVDKIDMLKVDYTNYVDEENEETNTTQEVDEDGGSKTNKEVFPVIGDYKFKKRSKVKRVLPDWLAKPSVVSVDLKNLDVSVNDIPELHSIFVNALQKNNVTHFFPVQAQVIPWLLGWNKRSSFFWPCDVCVSAPTGSGKTLAYVLPILQALMTSRTGGVQALVVLPVQDLAAQVASVFRTYIGGTGLKVHLSTGGLSLQQDRAHLLKERQGVGWESLVDILVITPGRLVEHLYCTPGFSLKQLQYIVIDEADRIVDNMQNNWLQHLDQHLSVQGCPLLTLHNIKNMPRRPQKLLFSATLSIDPEKLNKLNLFQPRLFTSVVEATKDKGAEGEFIGKFTTPAELQEHLVKCMLATKPLVLYQLITKNSWSHVLVFTSSSRSVHQLCALLSLLASKTKRTLNVAEISAECSFKKRESVLDAFTKGSIDVNTLDRISRLNFESPGFPLMEHKTLHHTDLEYFKVTASLSTWRPVALKIQNLCDGVFYVLSVGNLDFQRLVSTDSLARGMDIPGVKFVVSYDMPKFVKAYIHRVGRTGRAGQQGTAVTMVQHTQIGFFQEMLQTAGKQDVVTELTVDDTELKSLEEPFREALRELKTVTKDEEMEKLHKMKSLKRVTSSKILKKKRKYMEDKVDRKRLRKEPVT